MRSAATALLQAATAVLLAAQTPATPSANPPTADGPRPSFEIASVTVAPKSRTQYVRFSGIHGGRFEIHNATMIDLIRTAYGYMNDKIIGGPSWLEITRYNLVAKILGDTRDSPENSPVQSTPDPVKQMLQSLLESRFALKTRKDIQPQPTYALMAGSKPKMKEGDASAEAGCKPQAPPANPTPGSGISTLMFSTNGEMQTLRIGPGGQVTYTCHNLTMPAFATAMRSMFGANLGTNPILEETGLKGTWSFDITYSINFIIGPSSAEPADQISFSTAVDKQLGLKLEKRNVPTDVLVIDAVNEKPTPDPSGVPDALPVIPLPTEFEVASVVPAAPPQPGRISRFGLQAGGRFQSSLPLRFLIDRAFNNNNNREYIQNVPDFANGDRIDITAKANIPRGVDPNDPDLLAGLLMSLLKDRFKMTFHTEERPVTAYQLVTAKPKLKKADPSGRTHCNQTNAPVGSPPGTRVLNCVNATMAIFAGVLLNFSPDIVWPVDNATDLEGSYDFTLTFTQAPIARAVAAGGATAGAASAGASTPDAADPSGGYTIFQAIEKQLGIRLEKIKRNEQVIVIDHIEQKPTEN